MPSPIWDKDFTSFTEFTDFASQSRDGTSQERGHSDWFGSAEFPSPDFPSHLALARQGWEAGAKRIEEISAQIGDAISPKAPREELDYSIVGPGTIDLDRYQMGHPESYQVWVDTEDVIDANRGFLHLTVNICASAGVKSEVLFTKGASVCALIDALERSGYRCEVDVYARAGVSGHSSEVRYRLKNTNDPLELESMAIAIAHPASFRRLMLACWEQAPAHIKQACSFRENGGYGSPQDTQRSRGDIHIPMAMYSEPQWTSPQAAAQWVKQELARQGVTIEE